MARTLFTMTQKVECAFADDQLATAFESWLTNNTATSRGASRVVRAGNTVTITVPKGQQSYDSAVVLTPESRF